MSTKFKKLLSEEGKIPNVLDAFKNTIEGKIEFDGEWIFDDNQENYSKMYQGELQPELVASSRKHKITILRRIDSQYKDIAKKLMFLEYPDLLAVKQQRNSYEEEWGKNPPMINAPSQNDLDTDNRTNQQILDSAVR